MKPLTEGFRSTLARHQAPKPAARDSDEHNHTTSLCCKHNSQYKFGSAANIGTALKTLDNPGYIDPAHCPRCPECGWGIESTKCSHCGYQMTNNLAAAIDLIVRDGLGGTIEAVPLRMGGTPTITGHRFKVSQVLAEIANEAAINAFCDNFCTFDEPSERAKIHEFFRSLANAFDVTIAKPPLTPDQLKPHRGTNNSVNH